MLLTEKQTRAIQEAGAAGVERSWVVLTHFGPARITTRRSAGCWKRVAGTSIFYLDWIGGGRKVDHCWCASFSELMARMNRGPFWAWEGSGT